MIELQSDKLVFSFPDLPFSPKLTIQLQRTLRIPDDGQDYPLPPGLGAFPLRHIDDFATRVPASWLQRGGVILPMWQCEALWINLASGYVEERQTSYPFAIKVATGKVNAVSGEPWASGLSRNPQDYLVAPGQPWLDGYCTGKGQTRQFVAMPLGQGYSVEEQTTGQAEFGGLQIEVFPMITGAFEKHFPKPEQRRRLRGMTLGARVSVPSDEMFVCLSESAMGLAPGGTMRQEIYDDPYSIHEWDTTHTSRCFLHLVNSSTWKSITGEAPPTRPPTARDYTKAGYPWYDYYDQEQTALKGSSLLAGLKSVLQMGQKKGETPLPENQSVTVTKIIDTHSPRPNAHVRDGNWS